MKIAFFTCFINHHQVWVADELYKSLKDDYKFICCEEMPDSFKRNGYADYLSRNYIIRGYTENGYNDAMRQVIEADVAIFDGSENLQVFRDARLKRGLLTFESGERWLKRGLLNLLSPRLIMAQWRYHTRYYKLSNYYALCMSAFGASDYGFMHSFVGRCYKWGYFTKVENYDVTSKTFVGNRIMWCNRFIDWKHPEFAIQMAKFLKDKKFDFVLDMYGGGELVDKIKSLTKRLDIEDVVNIVGTASNDEIIKAMRNHDILLTTSDRQEGWGATVNEGMSNGCVVIGSDEVGCIPRLIQNEENGLVFKSGDINSLNETIIKVIGKPDVCKEMAIKAYHTMITTWNPENAAKRLLQLCEALINGKTPNMIDGPCSLDD